MWQFAWRFLLQMVYQFLFQEETKAANPPLLGLTGISESMDTLGVYFPGIRVWFQKCEYFRSTITDISGCFFCLAKHATFYEKYIRPKPSTFSHKESGFLRSYVTLYRRIYGIKSPVLSEEFFILRTHAELSSSLLSQIPKTVPSSGVATSP